MSPNLSERPTNFDQKKEAYFNTLASRLQDMLKVHLAFGLWDRDESGHQEWANVTEHCLMEAARSQIFADWLKLPPGITQKLVAAAVVHDAFKRRQTEIRRFWGPGTWKASLEARATEEEALRGQKIDEDIIYLSGAASHHAVEEVARILAQPNEKISPLERAFLVLFLIDAYTINDQWAEGDDINRRLDKTFGDPQKFAERYRDAEFKIAFEDLRQRAHEALTRLAEMMNEGQESTENPLAPEQLTLAVDTELRQRINTQPS